MPTLLIDADKIVYDVCFTVQESTYYLITDGEKEKIPRKTRQAAKNWCKQNEKTGEFHTSVEVEPLAHALYLVKKRIQGILNAFPSHNYQLYLTHPDIKKNFRYKIAKTLVYKDNRADADRPVHYDAVRQYMIDKWGAIVVEGYEADDAVLMNYHKGDIICGVDKDLFQFPGAFYNFDKKECFEITPEEGRHNFYTQVLYGDAIDNIPGVRYVCVPRTLGKKSVEDYLQGCSHGRDYYEVIKDCYFKFHLHQDEANLKDFKELFEEQCKLLWLMRHEDDVWNWDKLDEE